MKDLPTHTSLWNPRVVPSDGVVYITTPSYIEISQQNPFCNKTNLLVQQIENYCKTTTNCKCFRPTSIYGSINDDNNVSEYVVAVKS